MAAIYDVWSGSVHFAPGLSDQIYSVNMVWKDDVYDKKEESAYFPRTPGITFGYWKFKCLMYDPV